MSGPAPEPPVYGTAPGGLPGQTVLHGARARFTPAWALIPAGVMRDIVTSRLPGWRDTRAWVLARPLSGFAETFAHCLMEVAPHGGSETPEPDPGAQAVIFVTHGEGWLRLNGGEHAVGPGSYAYLPAGLPWQFHNGARHPVRFHWIRKRHVPVAGVAPPEAFVTSEIDVPAVPMPDTGGRWTTKRFVEPDDIAHDMHVNIVGFAPGGRIPFEETHVMEHGLYVLEGRAVYRLNDDWVEVEAGDFLWLRAFCPQACVAAGPGPFRYLLYKDVNRHAPLGSPWQGTA